MYKTIIFSALIAVLSFSKVYCQEKSADKPKFKLTDIYLMAGEITQIENTTSVERFQKFLPQSYTLKKDFSNYSDGGSGMGRNSSPIFSIMAGFKKPDWHKSIFRCGISVFANTYVSAYANRELTVPTDTLTSAQTGEKLYVSRASFQHYGMSAQSVNLRLDAAYIYNFFPEDRISFFAGIGAGSNFSINPHTDIYYSEESLAVITKQNGQGTFGYEGGIWSDFPERISHKGNFGFNICVPIGLDFRINEKGFLDRTHLIYEFDPGFNGQFGGLGDYSGKQWQHNLGLKIALK